MFIFLLVFWLLFYFSGTILERWRVDQGRWPEREGDSSTTALLASLLHAICVICAGIMVLAWHINLHSPNTEAQNMLMLFSLSWFVIDSAWLIYEKNWKKDLIIHHVICIIGLIAALHTNYFGWIMTAAICAGEMSPCFAIDILAKRWKIGSERFYYLNDTGYLIAFCATRFFAYTILTGLLWMSPAPLFLKILSLGLLGISYYWGVLLIKKYRRKWG